MQKTGAMEYYFLLTCKDKYRLETLFIEINNNSC